MSRADAWLLLNQVFKHLTGNRDAQCSIFRLMRELQQEAVANATQPL